MSSSLSVSTLQELKCFQTLAFNPLGAARILQSAMFLSCFLMSRCAVRCTSIFCHFHSLYFMFYKISIIGFWTFFNRFSIILIHIAMHVRIDFFPPPVITNGHYSSQNMLLYLFYLYTFYVLNLYHSCKCMDFEKPTLITNIYFLLQLELKFNQPEC